MNLKLVESDTFELAEPEKKWKKGCPDSVVLFGTDGHGSVCIIDHEGPDADYIMSDSLIRRIFVKEELRPWKFPGLWVWVGRMHSSRDYYGEYDEWTEGQIRPLNEDEARAIREEDSIWDSSLWRAT